MNKEIAKISYFFSLFMTNKIKPAKRVKGFQFPKLIDDCRIINNPFQIPKHSFIAAISSEIDDPNRHYQFYEVVDFCRVDDEEISLYLVEVDDYGKVFTKSKYKSDPTKFDKLKSKGYTTNWLCEKGEYFLLFDTVLFDIKKSTYIGANLDDEYSQRFIFFDENGYPDATQEYKSKFEDYDPEFDLNRDPYDSNIRYESVPSRGDWNIRNEFHIKKKSFEARQKVANDLLNVRDMDVTYYSPWRRSKGGFTSDFRKALSQLTDEEFDELSNKIISTRNLNSRFPVYSVTRELKKFCSKWPCIWKHIRRVCYEDSKMFLEAYRNS